MRNIKKYDKYLYFDKKLDGTKIIKRQSPFKVTRNFNILTIKNMYIGSGQWLFKKLQSMDQRRVSTTKRVQDNNKKLYRKREQSDKRIHNDIADFMTKDVV